jgi:hypothetical protein
MKELLRFLCEGDDAVLTSMGSAVSGLVRRSDMSLDFHLPCGGQRLMVQGPQTLKDKEAHSLVGANATQPLPERWENCSHGDNTTKALGVGIVIASKLYLRFKREAEAVDYVILLFTEANLIYHSRPNFVLICKQLHLQKTHTNAPDWDAGPSCGLTLGEQLTNFGQVPAEDAWFVGAPGRLLRHLQRRNHPIGVWWHDLHDVTLRAGAVSQWFSLVRLPVLAQAGRCASGLPL